MSTVEMIQNQIELAEAALSKANLSYETIVEKLAVGKASDEDLEESLGQIKSAKSKIRAYQDALKKRAELDEDARLVNEIEQHKKAGLDHLKAISAKYQNTIKAIEAVMKAPIAKLPPALKSFNDCQDALVSAIRMAEGGSITPLELNKWLAEFIQKGTLHLAHPIVFYRDQNITRSTDLQGNPMDLPSGVLLVAVRGAVESIIEAYGLDVSVNDYVPRTAWLNEFEKAKQSVMDRVAEEDADKARKDAAIYEAQSRKDAIEYYSHSSTVGLLQKKRSELLQSRSVKALDNEDYRTLELIHTAIERLAPTISESLLAVDTGFTFKHGYQSLPLRVVGNRLDSLATYWEELLQRAETLAADYSCFPAFGVGVADRFNDRKNFPTDKMQKLCNKLRDNVKRI